MSMPQYPNTSSITRQTAINSIISSIAAEELALSHIINAEGEKIQYAVGTIEGLDIPSTIDEVLKVNKSVQSTLDTALENQILLAGKLSDALSTPVLSGPIGSIGPIGPQGPDEGPQGPQGPQGVQGATGPEGLPGAIGTTGPEGISGNAGDTGAQGLTGPTGSPAPPPPSLTAGFAVNTSGSILTILTGGTDIPLPNTKLLSSDITLNSSNTIFTVNTAGYYRISYHINTTAALAMGSRILINGASIPTSVIPVSLLSLSSFSNEFEVFLNGGSTIQLQMFTAILGLATLLSGSVGASVMIIRLS